MTYKKNDFPGSQMLKLRGYTCIESKVSSNYGGVTAVPARLHAGIITILTYMEYLHKW